MVKTNEKLFCLHQNNLFLIFYTVLLPSSQKFCKTTGHVFILSCSAQIILSQERQTFLFKVGENPTNTKLYPCGRTKWEKLSLLRFSKLSAQKLILEVDSLNCNGYFPAFFLFTNVYKSFFQWSEKKKWRYSLKSRYFIVNKQLWIVFLDGSMWSHAYVGSITENKILSYHRQFVFWQ